MLFSKSDVGHPWQNGLSERTNQALKIIVKKLLIASGVPSEFWAYAMKYAATVRNITGVKVYNELQSPYNEVFGQGVDIQYFHPFGCKAYMVRNVIAQNLSNHHPATRLGTASIRVRASNNTREFRHDPRGLEEFWSCLHRDFHDFHSRETLEQCWDVKAAVNTRAYSSEPKEGL